MLKLNLLAVNSFGGPEAEATTWGRLQGVPKLNAAFEKDYLKGLTSKHKQIYGFGVKVSIRTQKIS